MGSVEGLTLDNPFGDSQRPRWHVLGTCVDETVVLATGPACSRRWPRSRPGPRELGNDNLKGGPGKDRLFGGGGNDTANGGPGTDTCRRVEFKRGCEFPPDPRLSRTFSVSGYSQPPCPAPRCSPWPRPLPSS